jgi:hypothetical protein
MEVFLGGMTTDQEPVPAQHQLCRPGTPEGLRDDQAARHRPLPGRLPVRGRMKADRIARRIAGRLYVGR